jgi:hypothetical protein
VSVSISIDAKTGMAIATCTGVFRLNDAQAGAKALWATPGWLGKSAVWDFREASFDLSASDLRSMAASVARNQPSPPPARVAFVTERDADFGIARMFEVFREDPRTNFRVFRDYDQALRWARVVD